MNKRFLSVIAILSVSAMLAGCGEKTLVRQVELSTFADVTGAYVFHGLDWLVSPKAVEQAHGVSLEAAEKWESNSGRVKYVFAEAANLLGSIANIDYEFQDGQFVYACYTAQGEKQVLDALYEELAGRLEALYDSPETAEQTDYGPRCRWLNDSAGVKTFLALTNQTTDRQTVVLAAYLIQE